MYFTYPDSASEFHVWFMARLIVSGCDAQWNVRPMQLLQGYKAYRLFARAWHDVVVGCGIGGKVDADVESNNSICYQHKCENYKSCVPELRLTGCDCTIAFITYD